MSSINKKYSYDIACAKHAMYLSMKNAGILVNGHITNRGFIIINKKKENNKKACRQKREE